MRKNGTCSTFKKEKEKVHQFLLNIFGSATIFLSAAWTMIFVTHLRSIWISIPFSFLYNCDLTSVILFCCTRSFSIQDHIYFLASQKSNSFKSNSFHLFHVSVQYTEPGIGWICICWWYKYRNQFFLRTDTAQRQITKIVYLKMSAIICSMFAYWIYNLLGYFLKPTLNTVVAE